MSDTKSGDDKTLSVTPKKTLTLKRPGTEQGTVRQNFSHGRTKQVQVEIKKRKFSMPGDKPEPVAAPVFTPKPAPVAAAPAPVVREAPKAPPPQAERSGMVLNELSRGEMEARRKALEGSKAREVEDRQRAQEDAKRRTEDEERRKREREEVRAPSGRGRSPLANRGRVPPPRRGRGPPPRPASRRAGHGRRRGRDQAAASWWRRRQYAGAPSGHAGSRAAGQAHQGRGRPSSRQADAECGAVG